MSKFSILSALIGVVLTVPAFAADETAMTKQQMYTPIGKRQMAAAVRVCSPGDQKCVAGDRLTCWPDGSRWYYSGRCQ